MNPTLIVAQHEFVSNVKKPSFLFALFGLPLIMAGIFGIVAFANALAVQSGDIQGKRIGYVDETGLLSPSVDFAAFLPYESQEAAKKALENGDIELYVVFTPRYAFTGKLSLYARSSVPTAVEREVERFIKARLAASADSDLRAELLEKPVNMIVYLQDSGRRLSSNVILALLIIPILFVTLFIMALQFSSAFLMSSIVEEKTNRLMEILLTSLTTTQLLAGKVLGLGLIGLLQVVVWVMIGFVVLLLGRNLEGLEDLSIPPDLLFTALIYFLISYFLYGGLLAGIGVLVDSEQESRQYAGVISFVVVIPLFFVGLFMSEPDSTLSVVLSFVPFTSGMAMLLRMAFGIVPMWQLALSIGLALVTTLFIVWAAAKLFHWGVLLYGKRVTLREIWQVLRSRSVTVAVRS